jgi:hypothetical protein
VTGQQTRGTHSHEGAKATKSSTALFPVPWVVVPALGWFVVAALTSITAQQAAGAPRTENPDAPSWAVFG